MTTTVEERSLELPIIDLSSPDRLSTAASIRQACLEHGLFYLVNHGVEEELLERVLNESKKFFSLDPEEKLKLKRENNMGYAAMYVETLDPSSSSKGDSKESFNIVLANGDASSFSKWPSADIMPSYRSTMEAYYQKAMSAAKKLASLVALSLNLDEDFFVKVGALDVPSGVLRLLHYPGEVEVSDKEIFGASAHSDYGMLTFLAADGVRGLQVCRDKSRHPRIWEDVPSIKGAFIVNTGDMMERWTNCLYRSTLHRVIPVGQERFSAAFFFDPKADFVVECLESCCSESSPPRFPPIRCIDYLNERFRLTYG